MASVCETSGIKDNTTYYHINDGYFFLCTESNSKTVYLKCKERRSTDCLARATMPLLRDQRTADSFIVSREHNHGPDHTLIPMLELRRRILERCRTETTDHNNIFDEECRRVPDEISRLLDFQGMKMSMYRMARKETDLIPASLEELNEMLGNTRNEKYTKSVSGDTFYHGSTTTDSGTNVYFGSRVFIELLPQTTELHIDGTFKVRPNVPPSRQLLTVLGMHFDQAFPIMFVLMETKSKQAYVDVLNKIKELAPQLQPRVVITDFERALHEAIREVFPTAHLVGCWFHSANAMRRKAKSLGLTATINSDATAKRVFYMTMAIPLLPHNQIEEGFRAIKEYAGNLVDTMRAYLDYVETTWIQGVGPVHLSVFGQRRRTNNDQEAFHRTMLRKMGHAHPSIWMFINGLRNIEHSRRRLYLAIEGGAGGRLRNRPSAYIANDQRIREASQLLSENALTPLEFLIRTSHSLASLTLVDLQNGAEEEENVAAPDPPAHPLPELPADPAPLRRERRGRGGRRRAARPQRGRGVQGQLGNAEEAGIDPAARGRGRGRGRGRRGRGGRGHRGAPQMEIHPDEPAAATIPEAQQEQGFMQDVWPPGDAERLSQSQVQTLQAITINEEDVAAGQDELSCITCGVHRRSYMTEPCGHYVMCGTCVTVHRMTVAHHDGQPLPIRCPICRCTVCNYRRVFQ